MWHESVKSQFPGATEDSKLPDDELLDLLEFGMPSTWQRSMTIQNFDPVDRSISEFVSFCELLEDTEPEDSIPKTNPVLKDLATVSYMEKAVGKARMNAVL